MTETDVISTDGADGAATPAPERRRRGGVSGMVLAELRDLATSLGVLLARAPRFLKRLETALAPAAPRETDNG